MSEPAAIALIAPPQPRRWFDGVARIVFPSIFLVYVLQTVAGISTYASGAVAVAAYVGIGLFCAVYVATLLSLPAGDGRRFWTLWAGLVVICVFEIVVAHQYAFSMFVFVGVPLIAVRGNRAVPVVVALVLAAFFLPALVPAWHHGIDAGSGFSTALILVAMFAFFAVIRSNRELTAARAEIGRLAADNERNRIARDLHDLLGHSLTVITVKAALARRLSATDPERAAVEIGEVEELTRRALTEVRAAVAGYREVTLVGELGNGREILAAVGVEPVFPDDVGVVRAEHLGLFGWVVREAITNVVRHARATRCVVAVGPDWIEITDDGRATTAGGSGSGLGGLRERVEAEGGRLVAGPHRGGWRIRVDIDDRPGAAVPAAAAVDETARP